MKTEPKKPVEQPSAFQKTIDAQFVKRVKQAVEEAGSVSRATRALRMSEDEIVAFLKENP